MNDSVILAGAIALTAVLAGVVTVVIVAPRLRAARQDAWRRFARRHQLRLRRGGEAGDRIEGAVNGRGITVRRVDAGSDAEVVGLATVRIELAPQPPPPRGLSVVNAGEPVGRVAHLLDTRIADPVDLNTTDPDFHLMVRESDSRTGALHYLTPLRRRALQELADKAQSASIGIEAGKLFWEERDSQRDPDYLETRLAALEAAADRLERADDEPDLPSSLAVTAQGRTE